MTSRPHHARDIPTRFLVFPVPPWFIMPHPVTHQRPTRKVVQPQPERRPTVARVPWSGDHETTGEKTRHSNFLCLLCLLWLSRMTPSSGAGSLATEGTKGAERKMQQGTPKPCCALSSNHIIRKRTKLKKIVLRRLNHECIPMNTNPTIRIHWCAFVFIRGSPVVAGLPTAPHRRPVSNSILRL